MLAVDVKYNLTNFAIIEDDKNTRIFIQMVPLQSISFLLNSRITTFKTNTLLHKLLKKKNLTFAKALRVLWSALLLLVLGLFLKANRSGFLITSFFLTAIDLFGSSFWVGDVAINNEFNWPWPSTNSLKKKFNYFLYEPFKFVWKSKPAINLLFEFSSLPISWIWSNWSLRGSIMVTATTAKAV